MTDFEKSTFVRVTITVDYAIPEYENDVGETIQEWFSREHLNTRHAYRDYNQIGGSKQLVKSEKITFKDLGYEERVVDDSR